MGEQYDRLVYDFSVITDAWDAEFDTNCHFTNIQAAYEGFVIWRNIQQVVYTPIFGDNLEDPETRDISLWESTKVIVFTTYQISTEIWAPLRELTPAMFETIFKLAYINTNQYTCRNIKLFEDNLIIEEYRVQNPSNGNKDILGKVYKPAVAGAHNRFPGLVLVPDDRVAGSVEFSSDNYLTGEPDAVYWAKKGYIVFVFDPDFRGDSAVENNQTAVFAGPGVSVPYEDWYQTGDNGHIHQDGLNEVLKFAYNSPEVDKGNLGIISHGWGLAMASGALARYQNDPPVKFLIDVEGQADRYDVSSDCAEPGTLTHLSHDCDDNTWWEEREPIQYIDDIKCRYIRVQYTLDHNQINIDHAIELIDAATNGDVPYTRINGPENPENATWGGGIPPITYHGSVPRYEVEEFLLREQFAALPLIEERDVEITYDMPTETTTVEIPEFVRFLDNLCISDNFIPESSYNVFINAIKLRGYADEYGLCPFTGDLSYLCDRRGYDAYIETIHQSTRNRLHTDINTLNLDTTNFIYSHIPVINFEDEWTLIDGKKRRFAKYQTEIRAWKPLKYHLRMAPAASTILPRPLDQDESLVEVIRGVLNFPQIQIPAPKDGVLETSTLDLVYSRTNIIPPADISFELLPVNQLSEDYLADLNLQMLLFEGYKTPIECYFNLKKADETDPIIDPNTLQVNPDDTFTQGDGTAPNSDRWKIISGVPRIQSGKLHMSTEYGDEIVQSRYFLSGNFDISVQGDLESTQNKSWWVQSLKLIFSENEDHWCYVGRAYMSGSGNHVRSRYYKGGANTSLQEESSTSDSVFYRMIRTGNEIDFFYKEYGETSWTSLGTLEMYDTDCRVELSMTKGNLNPIAIGNFDNVTVFPIDATIYDFQITTEDMIVINIDKVNTEYPIDTYGWAMRQKFQFYSHKVEAPEGIYNYTMKFRVKIPTLFGESSFYDFFSFTEWTNNISLQINVID